MRTFLFLALIALTVPLWPFLWAKFALERNGR